MAVRKRKTATKAPTLSNGKKEIPKPAMPKHCHALEITYVGYDEIRIKSPRFGESKKFRVRSPFIDTLAQQAVALLKYNKWTVTGYGEFGNSKYIVFVSTFESIKTLQPFDKNLYQN